MAIGDILKQGLDANNKTSIKNKRNSSTNSLLGIDETSILGSIDSISDYSIKTIDDISKYQINSMSKTYKTMISQHKKYINDIRTREYQLIKDLNREWSKINRISYESPKYKVKSSTKSSTSNSSQATSNYSLDLDLTPTANSLGKSISASIISGLDRFTDQFMSYFNNGINRFLSSYEANYSSISKSLSWDHPRFDNFIDSADAMIKSNKLDNIITTRQIMDKMSEVSKSGLMGQQAINKSMTDALIDTITDGFDKSTQEYTDLYALFGDDFSKTLAGATDLIKNQYGGRVIQAGFIDQYIQSNNDRLASMTSDEALQDIINAATQAAQLESQGVGTKAAMDTVISASEAMNNQFEKFQSGTPAEILMAQTARQGGTLSDVISTKTDLASMAASNNQLSNSAYANAVFGLSGDDVYALKNLSNRGSTSQTSISNDEALSHYEQMLSSAAENLDKTTEQAAYSNYTENSIYGIADTLKDMHPLLKDGSSDIISTLDHILAAIIGSASISSLLNIGGGGLGKGASSLGGLLKSGASKVGSFLSANSGTILRYGGGIAGIGAGLYDIFQGSSKSQEWIGSNTTGAKITSGIAGLLGGNTGGGLADNNLSVMQKLSGIGGNAAKWAAIGNMIVPGAGALVGGIGGGIAGAIGSENIAKAGDAIGKVLTSDKTLGEYIDDWFNPDKPEVSSQVSSFTSRGLSMATSVAASAASAKATNDDIVSAINKLIETDSNLLKKLVTNTENPSIVSIDSNSSTNEYSYDSQFASYTSNYKGANLAW